MSVVYINMFAKFDEIPAMTLQDIKESKRYRPTDAWTHTWTDNVKTVYPLQTKFAGGIRISVFLVRGLKNFGMVGTRHTYFFKKKLFWKKNTNLCILNLKGISHFKMHKIIFFSGKPKKNLGFTSKFR